MHFVASYTCEKVHSNEDSALCTHGSLDSLCEFQALGPRPYSSGFTPGDPHNSRTRHNTNLQEYWGDLRYAPRLAEAALRPGSPSLKSLTFKVAKQ